MWFEALVESLRQSSAQNVYSLMCKESSDPFQQPLLGM